MSEQNDIKGDKLKYNNFDFLLTLFSKVTTPAVSWNESISDMNYSMVTEFIFLRLSNSQELQIFPFVFFVVFYVGIVCGNLPIVITVASDSYLHSPLYFLLANLSLIDLCLSSVTAPKMIADIFSKHKVISFKGCLAQLFILYFFGGSKLVILIAMAFDRYVTICKPPRYNTVMCVLALWLLHGELASSIQSASWPLQWTYLSVVPMRLTVFIVTSLGLSNFLVQISIGWISWSLLTLVCSLCVLYFPNHLLCYHPSDHPATPFRQVIQGTVHFDCSRHSSSFVLWTMYLHLCLAIPHEVIRWIPSCVLLCGHSCLEPNYIYTEEQGHEDCTEMAEKMACKL